jgi:hypothetical protein
MGWLWRTIWEKIAPCQRIFALLYMIYIIVKFCISLIYFELHRNNKKRSLGAIIAKAFEVCVSRSADISG